MSKRCSIAGLTALLGTPYCAADIINVPNDYATIQEAVDAAEAGDVVEVEPNVYEEYLKIPYELPLMLRATDLSVGAVIRGLETSSGYVDVVIDGIRFEADGDAGEAYVLANGFVTVKNCTFGYRSGLVGYGPSLNVEYCMFQEGSRGILTDHDSVAIERSWFYDSSPALLCGASNVIVSKCTFRGNAPGSEGYGPIWLRGIQEGLIEQSTFIENTASETGLIAAYDSSVAIVNCTLVDNDADGGSVIAAREDSDVMLANCIIRGNGLKQIVNRDSVIRLFSSNLEGLSKVDESSFLNIESFDLPAQLDWRYRLTAGSPCIDRGWSAVSMIGDHCLRDWKDRANQPRFVDDPLTPDLGCGYHSPVDVGAFEYQAGTVLTPRFGDIAPPTGNGLVNIDDLISLINNFGPYDTCQPLDVIPSGAIDMDDLLAMIEALDCDDPPM